MLIEISRCHEVRHGQAVARRILNASEEQWAGIVHDLVSQRQLGKAVRQMNRMLEDPTYRETAQSALKRIGLLHTD